ncbi:hypothetical protein [Halorientalis halophila]|uniref:hypothetical protein n=1 Tax=Halorientalis halophila TaxID=3108499 RepID=UPI003009E186
MSDDSATDGGANAARMELGPDALHETDEGYVVDCPSCGSTVSLHQIVETGHCPGHLDADRTETAEDQQLEDPGCTASLSLELVWEE